MASASCAPAHRSLRVALNVLVLAGLGHPWLRAEPAAPFVARTAAQFWNPPSGRRDVPEPIDLEVVVLFYDPAWHLFWAQASDACTWFDNSGQSLPIESGERVRIQGTYTPAKGIDGKSVRVTVLAKHAIGAPVSINGAVGDVNRFDSQWVTAVGYVLQQQEVDFTHIQYDLLCDGRLISATVVVNNGAPVPQLLNRRVQVNFVYAARRSLGGKLLRIDGWIPQLSDLRLLGRLNEDPRWSLPVTPLDALGEQASDKWVRVVGVVRAAEAGESVTVRDETSQIVIQTEQPPEWKVGDTVEVIGRPTGHDLRVSLADPIIRLRGKPAAAAAGKGREPALKLRLAEQLNELRPDEAAEHFPVELRGIVTWSDPHAPFFFVQDSSGGVRVQRPAGSAAPPPAASFVTLEGRSVNGSYSPELELTKVVGTANGEMPPAPLVSLEEALTGADEATRVAVRGYLRQTSNVGSWVELSLTTASGGFNALVPPSPRLESLVGAMVRVTGVCSATANAQHQLTGVSLWGTGVDAIEVEQPRMPDPFVAPERPIASLRQYLGVRMLDRQVRVKGAVLYNRPAHYLILQQGGVGLLVLHRDSAPLRPGQWIEAVGIPGRAGNRLVLREAVWRPTASAGPPPLRPMTAKPIEPDRDCELVSLRGEIEDRFIENRGARLMLREGDSLFEARMEQVDPAALPPVGSIVRLTGVYLVQYDEYRHPRSFTLQLRTPADIHVIHLPSWWTLPRALAVAGGFAVCALLGIGWVAVLRRKVRQQTNVIREQMEREARMTSELERAARLESLGVLAGGIAHDFNNLLTVVMANLGLAAMDERVHALVGPLLVDAELGARRAADLTQQLLTFAKGGEPVRRAVALPELVRESAEFARHGSRIRCEFDFAPDLPPANVDPAQISRVVHNLVLNAAQAMPAGGVVRLALHAVTIAEGEEPALQPGRYVCLSVADQGHGIEPQHLPRIFEPYFSTKPKNSGLGLATVHSIIMRHQGHIRATSRVGTGTTFLIWLPVADVPPPLPATARSAPSAAPVPLRVLFMDDEEPIRRAAGGVLRHIGHDATLVGDGDEAVRAYETARRDGRPYDVVVLDLTVPGGTGGLAALEALRRIDPAVRAIVSSGYSNDPVLANHRAYGFASVVAKPYRITDLSQALQDVMSGPAPTAA